MDGLRRAAVLKGAVPSGAARSRTACVQGAISISSESESVLACPIAFLRPSERDFALTHYKLTRQCRQGDE